MLAWLAGRAAHVLIRNARVWPPGAHLTAEAALAGPPASPTCGWPAAGSPSARRGLRPAPGEDVMDAAGGVLLPGLHDHHVHLRALAAAAASVAPARRDVRTAAELAARLRAADADLPPGAWLRAVGYHESVAGSLDRHALDRLLPHRPVRVQHRTGALWMVNSLAAAQLGLDECELERGGTRRRRPPDRAAVADGPLARRPGARRGRGPGRGEQEGGGRSGSRASPTRPPGDRSRPRVPGRKRRSRSGCTAWRRRGCTRRRDGHHSGRSRSCSTTPRCRRLTSSPARSAARTPPAGRRRCTA